MLKNNQIFKCSVCGNITELLHAGGGQLVCCGLPMDLQEENIVDASLEKHVPIIEEREGFWVVKVGSIAHPMEESHYIEWIETETATGFYKKFLKPGDAPELKISERILSARAYCNLHGLWKSKS